MKRPAVIAYVLAILVIVLDQASKHWIVNVLRLELMQSRHILGPISFTRVANTGVSFGILNMDADWSREAIRWGLSAFSAAVAVGLAIWIRRGQRVITGLAVGLIMGGALGNLIDRVRYGAVVDFIDAQALHFPWVFNVADSAISVGVGLLLLESLLPAKRPAAA